MGCGGHARLRRSVRGPWWVLLVLALPGGLMGVTPVVLGGHRCLLCECPVVSLVLGSAGGALEACAWRWEAYVGC